jgi:hypothetical protein
MKIWFIYLADPANADYWANKTVDNITTPFLVLVFALTKYISLCLVNSVRKVTDFLKDFPYTLLTINEARTVTVE